MCRMYTGARFMGERRCDTVRHGTVRYDMTLDPAPCVRACVRACCGSYGGLQENGERFCCVAASSGGHRLQILLSVQLTSRRLTGRATARPRFGAGAAKGTRRALGPLSSRKRAASLRRGWISSPQWLRGMCPSRRLVLLLKAHAAVVADAVTPSVDAMRCDVKGGGCTDGKVDENRWWGTW